MVRSVFDLHAKNSKPQASENDQRVLRETGLYRAVMLQPEDPLEESLTGPFAWMVLEGGIPRIKMWDGTQKVYLAGGGISADRGNASVTLTLEDEDVQFFSTTLTAARTVTLPTTAEKNRRFRIVRDAATAGAFTLTVQTATPTTIKAIPSSTRAFVDVLYDGSAWRQVGYSVL